MKHHLPPLDSLKAFESAARHLSFSVAADELCISKGAISYQIKKLETHVQRTLFRRSTRQVFLTEAGQALLQTTNLMFTELDETLNRLHGESLQAGVSIATSTYVAARWLSPRISTFNEHNPNIAITLQHSVNTADFKLSDVDMAIQWGPCNRAQDQSRLYDIPMPLFPVIAPALLEKHRTHSSVRFTAHGLLESPLSSIPLLCEDRHQDLWNEWMVEALPQNHSKLPNPKRIISDANVRVQAAIDGQGFILADALMKNEINNGLLVQPFDETLSGYGYSLASSPARILSNNALILTDWFSSKALSQSAAQY